jgi:hypothetical protein
MEWLERRRNEAIAELTLAVATVAMLAAIVAAVRSQHGDLSDDRTAGGRAMPWG